MSAEKDVSVLAKTDEAKEAPVLTEGCGRAKETAGIPWNITSSQGFSIRYQLLFLLEKAMVDQDGWIGIGPYFSKAMWTCLLYWDELEFITLRKATDSELASEGSHFCKARKGTTHRINFSPEAWELATRVRREHSGQCGLPRQVLQEEIKESRDGERQHPAYGQLAVSRGHGSRGVALYGSNFKHDSVIQLTLSGSAMERGLNRNSFFTKGRQFEIEMSESQWAALLCSLNVGGGVPVTVRYDHSKGHIPECPYTPEVEDFRHELEGDVSDIEENLKEAYEKMELLLKGKTISKVAAREVLHNLSEAYRNVHDRLPYLKSSYEKAMGKSTEAAQREIQAKLIMLQQAMGKTAPPELGLSSHLLEEAAEDGD